MKAKTRPKVFPGILDKGRAWIEQTFGTLKRFKRVALRCEKTAKSFASIVSPALGFIRTA